MMIAIKQMQTNIDSIRSILLSPVTRIILLSETKPVHREILHPVSATSNRSLQRTLLMQSPRTYGIPFTRMRAAS